MREDNRLKDVKDKNFLICGFDWMEEKVNMRGIYIFCKYFVGIFNIKEKYGERWIKLS